MRSPRDAQEGIRRAWRLSCRREAIDPAAPRRLPLLFALDARLAIPGGFTYALDCSLRARGASGAASSGEFCAGHIGCSSGGGGCSGDGDGDGHGGCGGDGGGCGGD
jgi:hypothetical protein